MKAILRGILGPALDVRFPFDENHGISVGRSTACALALPTDSFLSGRHFEINIQQGRIVLRDLSSTNGTFVDGIRVREHTFKGDETIQAGKSKFRIQFDALLMPTAVEVLSKESEPLYAVLDAARDPSIYPLIMNSGTYYTSLYFGASATNLATVAPYLLYLPPGSEVLKTIIDRGWSKSWGVFLTSSQPTETVWRELRRSLYVTLENKQRAYFRFYDPRVLRVFLSIANAGQRTEFNGTMSSFFVEDEEPNVLLRFHSLCHIPRMDRFVIRPLGREQEKEEKENGEVYAATQVIPHI